MVRASSPPPITLTIFDLFSDATVASYLQIMGFISVFMVRNFETDDT